MGSPLWPTLANFFLVYLEVNLLSTQNDVSKAYSLKLHSGIARVPCARVQEVFLRPRQQKLRSLKWEVAAKVWKKQKQNITVENHTWMMRQTRHIYYTVRLAL